ncbi:hypothetical protein GCM10010172_50480 [Paractinoplanes ferrugineus]|uniref:Tetratricopeptide repeat protein n=1 Tax=Paractinoplanes ferrugineus TaxID=113564 RepID=A0A919MIT2_9ACTN|nr:tetratricopeptide repeat protein [Actinoplanes ferrugineus]GIE16369.1 hypothetical protein Afe05nite_82090 [Actinoplanes ferrugineus]
MPTDYDELIEQAVHLCEVHREAEATALLSRVLAGDPNHTRAWLVLARARLLAGDPAEALSAAATAGRLRPDEPAAHALAGHALSGLGRHIEAAEAVRRSVALDPGEAEWHRSLAEVLIAGRPTGREKRSALDSARTAVALAPRRASTHVTHGSVLLAAGKIGPARAALRHALALDPQDAAAHHELARTGLHGRNHFAGGRLAEAADGFARTLRLDPHEQLARVHLDRTLELFVLRTAVLQLMLGYYVGRLNHQGFTGLARPLAVAGVLGPALYAFTFLRKLSPGVRAYLREMLAAPRLRLVLTLLVVGAAAMATARLTGLGLAASALAAVIVKFAADPPSRTAGAFAAAGAGLATILVVAVWLGGLDPAGAVLLGVPLVPAGYVLWKVVRWRQRVAARRTGAGPRHRRVRI